MHDQYLIFELSREAYAVPVSNVLNLLKYEPDALRQPFGADSHIHGYLTYQGIVVPVRDLRPALGMPTMAQETEEVIGILDARKQDHINWLDELEASVREKRSFRLTTDPHACKFGKWYDALMASPEEIHHFTNGNGTLDGILHAFHEPHARIHAIAIEVGELMADKRHDDAMKVINRAREGDLRTMVNLFDRARALVASLSRTLLLVLEYEDERLGILVDQVNSLQTLTPEHMQSLAVESDLIKCMALPNPGRPPIALVNVESLYDSARAVAA